MRAPTFRDHALLRLAAADIAADLPGPRRPAAPAARPGPPCRAARVWPAAALFGRRPKPCRRSAWRRRPAEKECGASELSHAELSTGGGGAIAWDAPDASRRRTKKLRFRLAGGPDGTARGALRSTQLIETLVD